MKLIISEGQVERIKSILKEGVDDRYNREVTLSFSAYGSNFKGYEINYINNITVRLFYRIEIEGRSWGLKDISLLGISGPEQIEVEVEYYLENGEESSISVPLKLDWSKVNIETTHSGVVTIDEEVEVELKNDSDGNLIVESINFTVYTL